MLEILLVEDNPYDVEIALKGLSKARLANPIFHAADGVAALDLICERAQRRQRFGLILLDLNLPGMSGLELLERIKTDEFLKHTSVVVLTSAGSDPIIAKCYALGANGFAVKPVRFESCLEVAKQLRLSWLIIGPEDALAS